MKPSITIRNRHLSPLGVVAMMMLLLQPVALNASELTVLDLGPLAGHERSEARGINQYAQVVGFSVGSFPAADAIVWNGLMNILGGLDGVRSFGFDINEQGQVAGQAALTDGSFFPNAMVWTATAGPIQLSVEFSQARALNNSGFAVGNSGGRAFRWDFVNDESLDLGDLGGTSADAFDINETGQVVGFATDASGVRRTFRWTELDGLMDLGVPSGDRNSEARGINVRGRIVGFADNEAFQWTEQSGTYELPGLPNSNFSVAEDINRSNVIVGTSNDDVEDVAFAVVWIRRRIRNLNDFLPPDSPWDRLQNAIAVNDDGDIVGVGIIDDEVHAFLALSVPTVVN